MAEFADRLILMVANAILYAKNPAMLRRYFRHTGRLPNVADPERYSERMLWRKLVDHSPQLVIFTDKLATKKFIESRCPDLPVPRTLWVGHDSDAIPREVLLGNDVYIKTNHGCNFNERVCNGQFDRVVLQEKTRRWLGSVYGRKNGEWAYSRVRPRLFVEEAVGDAKAGLIEFNVRASNGRAILGSVMGHSKTPDQWAAYLDPEGTPTLGMKAPEGSPVITLPAAMAVVGPYLRAVEFARRLSVGVDYARFDFFWNGQDLFGGEITVYPAGGGADPANRLINAAILDGWDLRQAYFLKTPHTGWKRLYAGALNRRLEKRVTAATVRQAEIS